MRILHIIPTQAPVSAAAGPGNPAALTFLPHTVYRSSLDGGSLLRAPHSDVVIFDATTDLSRTATVVDYLRTMSITAPVIIVLSEGGLAAANPAWGAADIILAGAGPAEIDARLKLAAGHAQAPAAPESNQPTVVGSLEIDEDSYTATAGGKNLDLTFKEFELLKYLAQHPGRAFTRAQLLQDVWGYDYYGGTRTVDVHVRRLRAKLGPELDSTILTVRNVGYRFSPEQADDAKEDQDAD
ncbi:response regulator transcription factor [Brevibacterium sp. 50QC2O2]|uniref:winged helix-turn-helix transcriptional regulator n=1 Tax=Brevibacterium TaxID=1696 RepID=UPI00211D0E20|nr:MULTISPECIES: response regulator transcription factor [unclassified Brevibacterium]MCQ9368920.1 response regulator transcription factor [Brevibacterium sp. 91QC2O2]MCQ9386005.1 response regulator transcription factor [Brevibacterium sp. 68QC2CO]MCQ9387704.1 response regulator transcription factor [Brevibacterium sp. 50QC2O2]